MKKKLLIILTICFVLCLVSLIVNIWLFITLTIVGCLALLAIVLFLLANKLIKNTNWWKNQYIATKQFVSNSGYRDNIIRNYDIVNLGSNPAHFAFFYEDVKGQSWATGSQGQDMDFEILKYFHSYLREGGTVLIPIMPFTAISTYLKERPEYWGVAYYSKFAKILDSAQIKQLPYGVEIKKYLKYPLFYNIRAIRYLLHDKEADTRFYIGEQPMMHMELEHDATKWIKGWLKEFKLNKLTDVLNPSWNKYYNESIQLNQQIIDYCVERNLKPVLICVPMTHHLANLFPHDFHQYMVTDFVNKINVRGIKFLDYTKDAQFQDDNLYFNSFFLNLRGRKLFTKKVLSDLNLVEF